MFNESNVVSDILNTKKASQFYNLHLENSKQKTPKENSLKEIIDKGKKKSINKSSFLESFNFKNRKQIYKLIQENFIKNKFSLSNNSISNDIQDCLKQNSNLKYILNSNGGLFKVIEGAFYGFQIFESGFAFELAKHRKSINLDCAALMKNFILILDNGLGQDVNEGNLETRIIQIINQSKEDNTVENEVSLDKREFPNFKEESRKSFKEIYEDLKSRHSVKVNIENEGIL